MILNVCGIRSKIDTPDFREMCKSYDIICLSETKLDDVDNEDMREKFKEIGFTAYIKNRHNFTTWRSGGVLVAIKNVWIEKCEEKRTSCNLCVCIKINKEILGYEKDIIVIAAYIPPCNSRYSNVNMYEELSDVILSFDCDTNYFILCGDMNAHTQEREDIVILDECVREELNLDETSIENIFITEQMQLLDIPMTRKSVDKMNDSGNYGTALLDLCKNHMLCIFNGRCGKDRYVGKSTTTDNSVIDYFIGSPYLASRVKRFHIHDFHPLYSDKHCIVDTTISGLNKNGIEMNIVSSKDTEEEVLQEGDSEGKWEVDKKQQYIDNLDANKVQNLKHNVGNMSIECITSELKNILLDTAKITFPAKSRRTKKSKTRTKRTAPWYTGECRKKRQEYLRARSKNNKQGNDKTKADLLSKSKQ